MVESYASIGGDVAAIGMKRIVLVKLMIMMLLPLPELAAKGGALRRDDLRLLIVTVV